MARFSSHFKNAVLWTALVAATVLAVTWGTVWYYTQAAQAGPVPVKNFQSVLTADTSLTLVVDGQKINVKSATIKTWLESYTRVYSGKKDLRINDRLTDYLQNLSHQSGTLAKDVKFEVADGKINILAPAKAGTALNVASADKAVRHALLANISEVQLPLVPVAPNLTEDTISGLHITEKLATGQSNFSGSTAARIQNLTVASALFNGMLIPASKTFSFDDILGTSAEVDAAHGYAPEKVIDGGKIAYEYGGGICQVSTTMFRAALNAGLPIVERRPHAFPVHYYEPQGMDATVYPGSADLKFINDTPSYILVQTRIVGHILYFDFYGTSDGRAVTLNGPYQYDIQPDGAMKAVFTRTITYPDGTARSDTFNSNYKSPSLYPTEPNPYL